MSKILIVQATFYKDIAEKLLNGAKSALEAAGYEFDVLDVPGAIEIPNAINFAAQSSKNYAGYVALGCVIRGQTSHYDYVCNESISNLSNLALKYNLAVGNGILTVENEAQALERADIERKNKGGFAANTALRMIEIKNIFNEQK